MAHMYTWFAEKLTGSIGELYPFSNIQDEFLSKLDKMDHAIIKGKPLVQSFVDNFAFQQENLARGACLHAHK